jgi:hypothetical protein
MVQKPESRLKPPFYFSQVETQPSILELRERNGASSREGFRKSSFACSSQLESLSDKQKRIHPCPPLFLPLKTPKYGRPGLGKALYEKGGRTMRSINPDGSVTARARSLLYLLDKPLTPEEISQKLGQPLFHVKTSLREMVLFQIIDQKGERFVITEQGREKR